MFAQYLSVVRIFMICRGILNDADHCDYTSDDTTHSETPPSHSDWQSSETARKNKIRKIGGLNILLRRKKCFPGYFITRHIHFVIHIRPPCPAERPSTTSIFGLCIYSPHSIHSVRSPSIHNFTQLTNNFKCYHWTWATDKLLSFIIIIRPPTIFVVEKKRAR